MNCSTRNYRRRSLIVHRGHDRNPGQDDAADGDPSGRYTHRESAPGDSSYKYDETQKINWCVRHVVAPPANLVVDFANNAPDLQLGVRLVEIINARELEPHITRDIYQAILQDGIRPGRLKVYTPDGRVTR